MGVESLAGGLPGRAMRQAMLQQQLATQQGPDSNPVGIAMGFESLYAKMGGRSIRAFYRVNQKVELKEGEMIGEPLDELRIEVAKWLN